jgi:hypothetical protein
VDEQELTAPQPEAPPAWQHQVSFARLSTRFLADSGSLGGWQPFGVAFSDVADARACAALVLRIPGVVAVRVDEVK